MGQMEMKCIFDVRKKYFYFGEGYSSEWCGPWASCCDYLPFEEDLALYFNNFEFPLPKDDLYQVWLKFAYWFWRRFFKNLVFCCCLPLDKGIPIRLKNFESLSRKYDLHQV
jgi:hypothetical protein